MCVSDCVCVFYLSSVKLLVVVSFSVAQRAVAALALRSPADGAVVLWVFFTGRFIRPVLHHARNRSLRQTLTHTKHTSVTAPRVCMCPCECVRESVCMSVCMRLCVFAFVCVSASVRVCV